MSLMSLYAELGKTKTEEDVKDAYIKALGLKKYHKGLIDIQTNEIWFEAKDTGKYSSYAMFTQLLHYVQVALDKGESVPPFLAVIDTEKAALMKSTDVLPFLAKKTVKWGKSASQYTQEALDEISAHIGTYFVSFKIATHEEEFISTVKAAIKSGDIIRTQITPDNLKQVFDKWVAMIGREINGIDPEDYALLFFADIMHDGTVSTHANLPAELLHKNGAPVFSLAGKNYELGNKEGYRRFWAIYHRPPKSEYRDYLLERRDSLIPLDERSFKGAYYTPLHVVDKAYDKLAETLGTTPEQIALAIREEVLDLERAGIRIIDRRGGPAREAAAPPRGLAQRVPGLGHSGLPARGERRAARDADSHAYVLQRVPGHPARHRRDGRRRHHLRGRALGLRAAGCAACGGLRDGRGPGRLRHSLAAHPRHEGAGARAARDLPPARRGKCLGESGLRAQDARGSRGLAEPAAHGRGGEASAHADRARCDLCGRGGGAGRKKRRGPARLRLII